MPGSGDEPHLRVYDRDGSSVGTEPPEDVPGVGGGGLQDGDDFDGQGTSQFSNLQSLGSQSATITDSKPLKTEPRWDKQVSTWGYSRDNFEDISGWTVKFGSGSITADSSVAYNGSQSLRLDVSSDSNVTLQKSVSSLDYSGDDLFISLRTDNAEFDLYRISLLAPDNNNKILYTCRLPTSTTPTPFLKVPIATESITGSPDLTDVQFIRLIAETSSGNTTSGSVWFDDLRTMPEYDQPLFCWLGDDAFESHYTVVKPKLDEYGYGMTEFVAPVLIGGANYMSESELSDAHDDGWDIGSQTYSHNRLPQLSTSEKRTEFEDAVEWLMDRGYKQGARLCQIPFVDFDAETLNIAYEYHDLVGSLGGASHLQHPAMGTLNARGSYMSLSDAQTMVDNAVAQNKLTMYSVHDIGTGGEMSQADFESFVDYVHNQPIRVVTLSDLVAHRRQFWVGL